MEPFALVKMMGTFVANGITGRIVLYLLLLAAGVGVRCVLQRRRDFRAAVGISAGLWLPRGDVLPRGRFSVLRAVSSAAARARPTAPAAGSARHSRRRTP